MKKYRPLQTNFLRKFSLGLVFAMSLPALLGFSQAQEPAPVVKPNYAQAERYSSRYLRQFVYSSSVTPNWIGESDKFWYSYRTSAGTKYYRVDPKHATKEELFDHAKLASLLSELIRKPLNANQLPLTRVEIEDDGSAIKFVVDKLQYQYDLEEEELVKLGKAPAASNQNRFGRRGQRVEEEKKEEEKKEEEKKEEVDVKKNSKGDKETKGKDRSKEGSEKKGSDEKKGSGKFAEDEKTKSSDKNDAEKKVDNKSSEKQKEQEEQDGDKKDQKEQTQKVDDDKQKTDEKEVHEKKTAEKDKEEEKPQTDHRSFSPDRTAYVFTKGHDLYFVEIPEGYEYKAKAAKSDKAKDGDKEDGDKEDGDKEDGDKEDGDKEDGDKKDGDKKDGDKKEKEGDKEKSDSKSDDLKSESDKQSEEDEEEKELPIPEIGPDLDDTAQRLTEDGEEKFSFAFRSRRRGSGSDSMSQEDIEKAKSRKSKPFVTWSKDSKAFFVTRRDSRKVKELFVINSLSTPRPTLEKYAYSMPGEEEVSISHFHYFSRDNKKLVELKKKWKHERIRNAHWKRDGHQLRFVRADRLLRNVEFCELDLNSGEATCLIEDGFEAANISMQNVRYLEETEEMIWFSERSGWAHFYLYDMDGNLKNPITSGEFRASRIVDIDEENRLVYFTGNAREEGENVYQNHLYCTRLDGTGLTLLDPGNANHRSTLSPSKKYLVDNCSRVDMVPVSVLRDAQGNEIMKLEESDMSRLKEVGWKLPETFVVKAADGVTDLYGNIWKPFDFSPKKKYPIIAHVYPGPQMEGTSHTFSATAGNQQLAQLGFIVIQVGHRGGTPQRSKAYHSHGYFNLRDYGLADKKAAIEQLGQRFPWVDVERVGIYGHSGGGFMTAAALLREPYNDFFKVGVSTAGNHDNNIYNSSWSERYHGLKEVPVEAKKAASGDSRNTTARARRRSGAPEMVGDYEAFDSEESDFFYENEGFLNQDGDLEFLSDHDLHEGPQAFQRQDKEKDSGKTEVVKDGDDDSGETDDEKKREREKSDKSKDDKGSQSDSKKETRFEIEVPTNAELAENLKGHLFLIHGEADNNVHPANTLRLVDALIKANKRFDMLYLPATRHGFGSYQPYVTQRMYEYFAEHLLNDYQSHADMEDRK